MLTPSEESFLNAYMKALYKINPSLHNKLSRIKRVGVFTWILGWGVFSNARTIAKIKHNLCTLHQQNKLQDKQIKHLANYLNLTMYQVNEHSEMLYEMDAKMLIMKKLCNKSCGLLMLCDMNQTYYITSRIRYIEYRHLYMLFKGIQNLYSNI